MIGQVLMVSPLPIESVYALALMAIWGIAPKVCEQDRNLERGLQC